MGKKNKWVRLKRVINFLKRVQIDNQRGDAGIVSDTITHVIGIQHQKDTTFTINDSAVVARPKQ